MKDIFTKLGRFHQEGEGEHLPLALAVLFHEGNNIYTLMPPNISNYHHLTTFSGFSLSLMLGIMEGFQNKMVSTKRPHPYNYTSSDKQQNLLVTNDRASMKKQLCRP